MEDIAVMLLKQVEEAFKKAYSESSIIASTYKKVRDGTATYEDANAYSIEVGTILANAYSKINSGDLPNGRMYYNIAHRLITPTMGYNYDLISQLAADVQRIINEQAKIGIKPIVPDLNTDKVNKIVQRVADSDNYDDISWILDEPVKTFSQSIVDDTIKANVEFHAKSGMKPVLIRKISGSCCKWCAKLAGTYSYPDVPKDVYRRHQRCRCTVSYEPGKGKIQNVWTKDWDVKDLTSVQKDYMGRAKVYEFEHGNEKYAVKAYKNEKYDNIWCQTYSKESQEMSEYLNRVVSEKYPGVNQIVICKNSTLQGIAAYEHSTKSLFISEELISEEKFLKIVDTGYFAARNLDDILIHELGGHKKHWEAIEKYYKVNKCSSMEEAKQRLEMNLRNYIVSQIQSEFFYVKNTVSENAYYQYKRKNMLNEFIADAIILKEKNGLQDSLLIKLLEEVINYDGLPV